MFTPDQIAFIESIVDKRIAQCNSRELAQQLAIDVKPPCHTVAMIRGLIVIHEPALRDALKGQFTLVLLAHEVAKFTALYDRDREPVIAGAKTYTRWVDQVKNAIMVGCWPRCPIVPSGIHGYYRFVDEV